VSAVVFAVISAVSIAVLVKIFVIVIKIVAVVEIVVSNTRSQSYFSRKLPHQVCDSGTPAKSKGP